MPRITFTPDGTSLQCEDGDTVFEVARRAEVPIETACVGKGTCGLCRIKIIEGADHLAPFSESEERHLGNVYYLTWVRLACQCVVRGGDVVVELAPKRPRGSRTQSR